MDDHALDLAGQAVAFTRTFSCSQIRVGGETYILSTMVLSTVSEKCGWVGYEIVRSLDKDHLRTAEYQHPFCNRTGKFFAGDAFVDNTTGTGFVHIAPGHGLDDYNLGREHGLPIYSPVDDDGCLAYTNDLPREQQMPESMIGKSILEKHGKSEANEAVLAELRTRNALVHQEDYLHSYPHCWRSKTPIIFRAMDQWFVEIDHGGFRQEGLRAIERINWVPEWGKARIEGAVKSRPDWCISRQRTWGVPIPAFYDRDGNALLDPRIVRSAADLIEQHGSNVWFEKSAVELWKLLRPADWQGSEATSKSADTLDVWIDSGSSSRAVLMRRPELTHTGGGKLDWQADIYLEGSDQHRGWFQSSLLLSLAGNGAPPYKTVLTHGFMVDADREKISKSQQSQGAYEKPQTSEAYIRKYGVDVVRLWVASQDFRNDIVVSDERINKVGETYRVIRNALRYQLSNLYDFHPAKDSLRDQNLTGLDRWILAVFSKLEADAAAAYSNHEFHVVYQKVSQFAAVELSAIYHDVVKDRLYTDAAHSPRRRSTQTSLHRMVSRLCAMLSPILTFTADEAWEFLPDKLADSVHLSDWTPLPFSRSKQEEDIWATLFKMREAALAELEKARQSKLIGKALEAKIVLSPGASDGAICQENRESLRELLNISQLELAEPLATDAPKVIVAKADGQKCERCWHWETDVGKHAGHPTICGRCVEATASKRG